MPLKLNKTDMTTVTEEINYASNEVHENSTLIKHIKRFGCPNPNTNLETISGQ